MYFINVAVFPGSGWAGEVVSQNKFLSHLVSPGFDPRRRGLQSAEWERFLLMSKITKMPY